MEDGVRGGEGRSVVIVELQIFARTVLQLPHIIEQLHYHKVYNIIKCIPYILYKINIAMKEYYNAVQSPVLLETKLHTTLHNAEH